jgi:hypothetical protein
VIIAGGGIYDIHDALNGGAACPIGVVSQMMTLEIGVGQQTTVVALWHTLVRRRARCAIALKGSALLGAAKGRQF